MTPSAGVLVAGECQRALVEARRCDFSPEKHAARRLEHDRARLWGTVRQVATKLRHFKPRRAGLALAAVLQ